MERGALTKLALDEDEAFMLRHHLVRDGETQTCAAALPGREERFEDALHDVARHAFPRVADRDLQVALRMRHDAERKRRIGLQFIRFDGKHSAVGHGIAGIRHEVRQDLRDLGAVSLCVQARRNGRHDGGRVAEEVLRFRSKRLPQLANADRGHHRLVGLRKAKDVENDSTSTLDGVGDVSSALGDQVGFRIRALH